MHSRGKNGFQRTSFFRTSGLIAALCFIMYGTTWGLMMSDVIPRDVPFLKKLFITQLGEFSSPHIVDLDENGIKFYNISSTDRLLRAPNGQITFHSLINGNSFGIGSVRSGNIAPQTLELSDFGIPMINYVSTMFTGSCAPGLAMKGIANGAADCMSVSTANAACPGGGTIQGWSSTGLLLCSGGVGGSSSAGGEIWHTSTTNTNDIFYGTRVDDNNGNVGIGTDNPTAKLALRNTANGYIVKTPPVFVLTGGSSTLQPKPCPYNANIAITSTSCVRQHGICGSANGGSFGSTPSSNLCTLGNPSTVAGNGPWTWTCNGVNGGNNSPTCSAVKTNNGVCGSAHAGPLVWDAPTTNLCNGGTPTPVVGSQWGIGANYNWTCQGSNGGTNASCWVDRIVHGMCVNRNAYGNNDPLGLNTSSSLNSKAACQGIKWFDPYYYVLNFSNVVGNVSTPVVTYICNGINGGQPSGQCMTSKTQFTTYSSCGSAAGGTFSSAPTSNLCYWQPAGSNVNGAIGSVTVVNGPGAYQWYKWTCQQYGMTCSSCTNPGVYQQQTCYARKQ